MQGVSDYFAHLPGVDNPEIFGMHENANVTFNTNESLGLMQTASARIENTELKIVGATWLIPFRKTTDMRTRRRFLQQALGVSVSAFVCTLSTQTF